MKKTNEVEKRDIEKCRDKIHEVLREYNCALLDVEDGYGVLLLDRDTNETINAARITY